MYQGGWLSPLHCTEVITTLSGQAFFVHLTAKIQQQIKDLCKKRERKEGEKKKTVNQKIAERRLKV